MRMQEASLKDVNEWINKNPRKTFAGIVAAVFAVVVGRDALT